jgi:hypothetical protein
MLKSNHNADFVSGLSLRFASITPLPQVRDIFAALSSSILFVPVKYFILKNLICAPTKACPSAQPSFGSSPPHWPHILLSRRGRLQSWCSVAQRPASPAASSTLSVSTAKRSRRALSMPRKTHGKRQRRPYIDRCATLITAPIEQVSHENRFWLDPRGL